MTYSRILTPQQEDLLKEERIVLDELRQILTNFEAAPQDIETLRDSIRQLDDLFLLVVVGEFNAGKSALINALLGQKLLMEGVTPTTTQINILKHGENQNRVVVNEDIHVISLPVELLSEISIVDTPGTNAIIRAHEKITSEFTPRSDLVLFITSADRPFTESERAFLERIRDWGKKVLVIINKIDLFQSEDELEQVKDFVADNARQLLGVKPEVFPVSARLALRAKQGEPALWGESRFEPLERYIYDTLDEIGRLRLKFLNPLGVGEYLVERYLEIAIGRLDLLKEDFQMLGDVEAQLALYKEDMGRDFEYRMADIENILYEMEQRGQDFFDDTFRLPRVFDLLNKARVQNEFEQKVVGDAPQRIERKVNELIDWLVDIDLRQWQAVHEHLAERRRAHQDRIVGDADIGAFHYDRERLIEGIGREAQRVVETFDKSREARAIAEGAQNAVAASAALATSAVGLGAMVTILATTVAMDVTGILMASLIAALGLFVIPARRRQAKAELRDKVADMRQKLAGSLRVQFEKEIERSLRRIEEAIGPYTRFVRAEKQKLLETHSALSQIKNRFDQLRNHVDEL
jgi:small GTP-binding protein